jgi:hypothetical protein
MNTQFNVFKPFVTVAIITGILLLIPFIAMQFSDEVNWSLFDFIFAGAIIFGFGTTYKLITRKIESNIYKIATGLFLIAIVLLVWVNGAVGILGTENNPENMLYGGVVIIGILGSLSTQLKSKGMTVTLFMMALVQLLVPIIAFFIWKPETMNAEEFLLSWHDKGILGVIGVTVFFVMLFLIAGLLYRFDVQQKTDGGEAFKG